jgi:hypothetical protein
VRSRYPCCPSTLRFQRRVKGPIHDDTSCDAYSAIEYHDANFNVRGQVSQIKLQS